MALKNCHDCGKQISAEAKTCPNCGAPGVLKTAVATSTDPSLPTLIIFSILAWATLFFIYNFATSENDPIASPSKPRQSNFLIKNTPSVTSQPLKTPQTTKKYTPPLEVISFGCDKEHGFVFVRGEVKNVSNQIMENVMAVGDFRAKNGTLVKTEDALIDYNPILPNQTSSFKAGVTSNPAITSCDLSFRTLFGERIGHTSLENKKEQEKGNILLVQIQLKALGYDIGASDGILGTKTKRGIKQFQRSQGMPENGEATADLLEKLSEAYLEP